MSCLYPLPYKFADYSTKLGMKKVIVLPRTPENLSLFSLRLPCGKCVSCRLKRSKQWAIRCMHEARMHDPVLVPGAGGSCFITLTYNDEHLPLVPGTNVSTLFKRDFQLFMKRLRKRYGEGIRYYYAGEYGSTFGRPHYHALIFGLTFDSDKYLWEVSSSGFQLFRSPSLESLWSVNGKSIGYSSVADLTFESAAYVARYCMSKASGDEALSRYAVVDEVTGELLGERLPEFNNMSTNGGIGKSWFSEFSSSVFPNDEVIVKGKPSGVPKYYSRLFEKLYPEEMEVIKEARLLKLVSVPEESLPALRKCVASRYKRLVRTLD